MASFSLKNLLTDFKQHRSTVHQIATLFGSKIGVIGLGLLIKAIQTRALTPDLYGLYAFFITLTAFTALFFRFGYFTSLKVLLANNQNVRKEKEYLGLGVLFGLLIGSGYVLFLAILSFFINDWFAIEFGSILLALSPLCIVYPLQHLLQDLSVGTNKVNKLASYDIGSKLLFLMPLSVIFLLGNLSLEQILWYNVSAATVSMVIVFISFRPRFTHLSARYKALKAKQKSYGRHYYLGNVANQSTFKIDELLVSYFINTTQLGFYSLANMICSPMVLMSQSLTNALFRDFASKTRIPRKVFVYNTLWLTLCILVLFLLSELIVSLFFDEGYSVVSKYILPLSIAYFFQGLYQPFSFLNAKSWGKAVRNVSLVESVINVAGNFTLILFYGVYGVIITSILAKLVHFLGLAYYYRQYEKTLNAS